MRSETIDNDNNDDDNLPSKGEESLLVENKQPEEPLPIGQDFETEVLEEKDDDDENTSTVPTKQKEGESLSRIKPEKRKEKKKD